MADLDNLQIQIKASSSDAISAIDKLIGALSRLNTSLNNYKAGSQYAQGMETLASGLERVSRAVNSIDDRKIRSLSSALTSLNKAGGNISLSNTVNKEVSIAEKRVDALARKVSDAFNIKDKASRSIIREDVAKIVSDKNNFMPNMKGLENDVKAFAQIENMGAVANKQVESVRQALKALKWDFADSAEYGDDLIRVFGKIGARNLGKGTSSASEIARELNETEGFQFDTSSNTRALDGMLEVLKQAEQEQISLNEAIKQGQISAQAFAKEFYQATKGLEGETFGTSKLSNEDLGIGKVQELSNVNTNSLQAVAQGLQAIQSVGTMPDFTSIGVLAQNINKLSTEKASNLSVTLPEIAKGLSAFNGLNIPNFPNIEAFAKGLKELRSMGAKSASEASATLPKLAESLRGFQGVTVPNLEGIETFSKALRSLGSKNIVNASTSLQPLAEGLRSLSDIQINADVEQLTAFAKAINSLGKENTATAIENLPRLAQAFNELVSSIEQSNISDRTLRFAEAMAQISKSSNSASAGMQRVGKQAWNWSNLFTMLQARVRGFVRGGLHLLVNYLRTVGNLFVTAGQRVGQFALSLFGIKKHSEDSAKSLMNLARAIGKFWASMFWVINGIRGLWKSIESSMDYIETLNYFKASFRQVSETAVGNWQKLGYESAEAYANSFEKRAKQLTSKMTGFTIEDTGVLSMTGGKTLGLNPNTLLNYQAQFAQMASSMGASANNATLLSQALVEIGADLASVKNMKFEDVWQDMASGMVGMSRTLDKYGVNIRKASLNQKLLDLGLDTTVDKLSGADKAMLRTIVLLDSTKYAWGDLANTINQPANQLRLLTANLQNCARMLGNIFLPLVAKVLPYLNAITIAVQRLLTYIAQIFGIDISKITSGVGGSNEAISDLLDDADNLDDSLDDASESAKKLKNNLLGVDELNIVSDNITSTDANGNMSSLLDDAFLDALSDYQKAWDEAFDAMENRANELADKIANWFKELFKPISKAWANVGQDVKEAWSKAFKSLGDLLKTIFKDAWDVWQSPMTTKIFENLFNTVKDIGLIISNLADNFRKAWEEGGRGQSILEAIWKIVWAISENVREVADYFVEWSKNLNFAPILESAKNLLEAIARNAKDIIGIFADWYKIVWGGIGKYLIEVFFPSVMDSLTKMVNLIDWQKLRADIDGIYESLVGLAEIVGGALLKAFDNLSTAIGKGINPFIENLSKSFKTLVEDLKNAKDINDVVNAIFNFGDDRAFDIGSLVGTIAKKLNEVFDKLNERNLGGRLAGLINNLIKGVGVDNLSSAVANLVNGLFDAIIGFLDNLDWKQIGQLIGKALGKIQWTKIFSIIGKALSGIFTVIVEAFKNAPVETSVIVALFIENIASAISKALTGKGLFSNIFSKLLGKGKTGLGKEQKGFDMLGDSAEGAMVAKLGFNEANKLLAKGAVKGAGELGAEAGALGAVGEAGADTGFAMSGIISTIAGIALTVSGGIIAIKNFVEQLKDGFSWANEGLMLLGIAIAGVGAVLLGAPALVAGVVAGIVAVVATGVVLIKEHWQEIKDWFAGLGDWLSEHVGQPIKRFFTETLPNAVNGFKEAISSKFEEIRTTLGSWITNTWNDFITWKNNLLATIGEWATGAWEKISTWATNAGQAIKNFAINTTTAFGEWVSNSLSTIGQFATDTYNAISQWASDVWGKVTEWASNVVGTLKRWYTEATDSIKNWFGETKQKFLDWKAEVERVVDEWRQSIINRFNEWKDNVISVVSEWARNIGAKFVEFKDNVLATINEWKDRIHEKFVEFRDRAITTFSEFKDGVRGYIEEFVSHFKEKIAEFAKDARESLGEFKQKAIEAFTNFYNSGKEKVIGFIEQTKSKFVEWKNNIITTITGLKDGAIRLFQNLWEGAKEWFSSSKWTFDGIRQGLTDAITSAWNTAKQLWDNFKDWLATLPNTFENLATSASNFVKNGVNSAKNLASSVASSVSNTYNKVADSVSNLASKTESLADKYKRMADNAKNSKLDLMKGRQFYATGGFPEDGWFRASHGEIMGRFDNGKSVVANNEQITDGIARAVYSAMMDAGVGSGGREEALLEELIQAVRSGQHITIDGRELVNAYDNRKARNGYAFT